MLWVGLAYNSMPPLSDWQIRLTVGLQHGGQVITNALSWLPNWAGAVIVLALVGLLSWYALRQVGAGSNNDEEAKEALGEETKEEVAMQEETVEH